MNRIKILPTFEAFWMFDALDSFQLMFLYAILISKFDFIQI